MRANANCLPLTCAIARLGVMRPRRVVPAMLQAPNACDSTCASASTCSRQGMLHVSPNGECLPTL